MKNKFNSSKTIMKSLALGSVLTLTASMTAFDSMNSMDQMSAKAKEQPKENNKKVIEDPTKYANGDQKPNVIYIVLDDIGFSDIGAYGLKLKLLISTSLQQTVYVTITLMPPLFVHQHVPPC